MADATVKIEGAAEFARVLHNANVAAEVAKVIGRYAQTIRSDAINSMRRSTPGGHLYRIKGKRKKAIEHRASAPGQPPAVQSGRLWNSITVAAMDSGLSAEVGPTVNYGAYLEKGTKNMDPRPFMQPAFDRNIGGLQESIRDAIRKAGL